MDNPPPVALTVAGSDSGGGAGIQADLKTFHAFGVYGCSALTAVTAQNTLEVVAVHAIPEEMVRAQIRAVATDISIDAVKTGMLASAALVETVAHAIAEHRLPNYVLDPVMISTSGHRLLDRDAEDTIRRELIPLAAVVTPNLHEARILTGLPVDAPSDLADAAQALLDLGARAALVKGGHLAGDEAIDLLLTEEGERIWSRPRISTPAGHGTGCTLSAALAAGLAAGKPLADAAAAAVDFVARALADPPGLGAGRGPINHLVGARPELPERPGDA
jgi:hydroxymethylpyrimidine/phosphomethylpyrimidine kinase